MLTGRLFGATAYDNLLRNIGPQAGVARRPSSATIQQAVARAHALAPGAPPRDITGGAAAAQPVGMPAFAVDAMRQTLAPVVRDALAPLHAMLAAGSGHGAAGTPDADTRGRETELVLTRAALEDAHARIRRLEAELGEVRRELGAAQAARDLAGEHVNAMLAELREAIVASGHDGASLARAADQLAGTERFLKAQNDAVRLQDVGGGRRAALAEPAAAPADRSPAAR
nr:hypothetical protein [Paraburkholderia caribensis]